MIVEMPTFTAVALDTLLEPGSRNPRLKPPPTPVRVQRQLHVPPVPTSEKKNIPSRPHHAVSPSLYTTPDVTPLPDSPSSFSPSPYIVNHKRRGPRLLKSYSQDSVVNDEPVPANHDHNVEATNVSSRDEGESKGENLEEAVVNGALSHSENGVAGIEETGTSVAVEVEREVELDDFFYFQDSASVTSNTDTDDNNRGDRSFKPSTPNIEYYDAFEGESPYELWGFIYCYVVVISSFAIVLIFCLLL